MDPEKQALIPAVLEQAVLARIAAADPRTLQPHVVPVWFLWDGQALWISAFSSTRKVKLVRRNPRISVLIEPQEGTVELQAVLLEGACELIAEPRKMVAEMSRRIYARYMGEEGAQAPEPASWAVDPENRLIKLVPERVFAW